MIFKLTCVFFILISIRDIESSSVWQRGFKCHYDSTLYGVGESWTATDGCNTCSCHAGDLIVRLVCTEKPCPTQALAAGQCSYYGNVYNTGDSFQSHDKCNTCGCRHGLVMCTERACLIDGKKRDTTLTDTQCNYHGTIYNAGDSFKSYDGCNKCSCGGRDLVLCTLMACVDIGKK